MRRCDDGPETLGSDAMWLLSYLFVLCVTQCQAFQCSPSPFPNQVQEYIICPNNTQTENFYDAKMDKNECDYSSILPLIRCDSHNHPPSGSICWRVRDPASGTVEMDFPLLPQNCNFTSYDLTLMVNESTVCPASGDYFKKHSKKEVSIKYCTKVSCMDQCRQRGSLVFRHVFSACYQLYLVPRRNYRGLRELVSEPVILMTQYTKTLVSTIPSPILHLDWDNNSLSMQAKFPMSPASSLITLSHGINTSLGQHACRNTGSLLATCTTCLESPEIQCKSENSNSVPTCYYQEGSVVRCKFTGLKPGNYCVRIQFDDERCVADTVWDDNSNYLACTWEIFQRYLTTEQPGEVLPVPNEKINPGLLIFIFIIVIGSCSVVGYFIYRRMLPSYPQFLPVHHKPHQIPDRPTVLLLYARDCPLFLHAVHQLKTVMRRVYNCQVIDCWEDSQYEDVAQSPARWLLGHLTDHRVRTVLVTSPASVLLEGTLVHNTSIHYRQPRAFDCVISHALTSLHETYGQNSYKRVFIVRLDTGEEGVYPKLRTYLNPLTTYVLPVHLNKLMAILQNVDSAVVVADGQSDVAALRDNITEYRQYLRDNPRYLDSLLVSETGTTVHHILA